MFKFIFSVSREHEFLAIFNHFAQRVQQTLWSLFISFFLHSLVSHRNPIWDLAQMSATDNARVTRIFWPVLYVQEKTSWCISLVEVWLFMFTFGIKSKSGIPNRSQFFHSLVWALRVVKYCSGTIQTISSWKIIHNISLWSYYMGRTLCEVQNDI